MRTLVNVGELGPGEERFPQNEVYSTDDYPSLLTIMQEGRSSLTAVDDPNSHPAERELLKRLGKESSLAVPMVLEGKPWGELEVMTAPGRPRLSSDDVGFLRAIGDQLVGAIHRAELFAQIEALAYTDALTGVASRRAVETALEEACAAPGGRRLTCARALRHRRPQASQRQRRPRGRRPRSGACRRSAHRGRAPHQDAVVGRFGGDEFCVLLPSGSADGARLLALDAVTRLDAVGGARLSCGVAARTEGIEPPGRALAGRRTRRSTAPSAAGTGCRRGGGRRRRRGAGPAARPRPRIPRQRSRRTARARAARAARRDERRHRRGAARAPARAARSESEAARLEGDRACRRGRSRRSARRPAAWRARRSRPHRPRPACCAELPAHVGLHEAGAGRVDLHAGFLELGGEDARHGVERRLRDAVAGRPAAHLRDAAHSARDVHHARVVALPKQRQQRDREPVGPEEVRVEGALDRVEVGLRARPPRSRSRCPRCSPARPADPGSSAIAAAGPLDRLRVRYVERSGRPPTASAASRAFASSRAVTITS